MPETAHAARRNLVQQTLPLSLILRHGGSLVVYVVMLATSSIPAPAGVAFAAVAVAWSGYRLLTRSTAPRFLAVDYAVIVVACVAIPALTSNAHLATLGPLTIAGTAVGSFTGLSPRVNVALTVGAATAYAIGAASVVGWRHVADNFGIYYFAGLWGMSMLIRALILRVTDSVDAVRADRLAAELQHEVDTAVREYDREQLRLLHDTVASTLLMVSTGASLAPDRLSAQARRDLRVFIDQAPVLAAHADLVAALRSNTAHLTTPVRIDGPTEMWTDGAITNLVSAAAREALTNVDRHARASTVTITVRPELVRIEDDGCGFDTTRPSRGRGIADSIAARMHRLGGDAVVLSRPGQGTTVELRWPAEAPGTAERPEDPERLIERGRARYYLALTTYAVANVLAVTPFAALSTQHPYLQSALLAAAAAITVSSAARGLGFPGPPRRTAIAVLLVISLAQIAFQPTDLIGSQAQWAQGAIGWSALPLLLNERLRCSIAVLVWCWAVPAISVLVRDPSTQNVIAVGYGAASILLVQTRALLFDKLIRASAAASDAEIDGRKRILASTRIAAAVQAEYKRRYADLAETIAPLLRALADGAPVDAAMQRQAQIEYQRLRALFDQSPSFEHTLLRELRPVVDAAQDRGVDVSVTAERALPAISDAAVRRLAQLTNQALRATTGTARITLTAEPNALNLSILCHHVPDSDTAMRLDDEDVGEVVVTTLDESVWITVRQPLVERTDCHALTG
ncbi:sensor histidine kinase [Mycolicibacterium llatzerense]|uniref:sensor histidine kinase n=1 Tax=Mycolicibacterium llatzerense TaxID=280871 RepID=UPI0008DDF73D|nr:ATP-binding protein [Mycolicibacterium llatzerense]